MSDNSPLFTPSQKEAVEFNNGNLLVSASAGSGKTFVMISRVVDLILSGKAEVNEILALTFTNLAADEMKRKLVKEIVKSLSTSENPEDISRLKKALSDSENADFSTFHGFLSKILRSYFYSAGIDPLFEISDEADSKELKNRAIERLFNQKYKSKDEDFLYLVRIYFRHRSDNDLKNAVMKLAEFSSSEPDFEEFLNFSAEVSEEKFKEFSLKLKNLYKTELVYLLSLIGEVENKVKDEKYSGAVSVLKEETEKLISALGKDGFSFLAKDITLPRKSKNDLTDGETTDKIKEIKEFLVKTESEAISWFSDENEELIKYLSTSRASKTLSSLAKEFDDIYSEIKRAENKADFSDLERLSLNLLRSDEEVLREISGKYKYVFADEYQDVNGVQEEILSLLSKDNLFMVGDVKQSIYGFRGCNPDIFASKYDNYLSGGNGKALSLDENFRSANEILNAVNLVFGKVMTKEFGGVNYADNPMKGYGLYDGYSGEAVLHLIEGEKIKKQKSEGLYGVLKAYENSDEGEDFYEGILTAELIAEEIGKPIYDLKTGETRKVGFGDIAVLTRNSKGYTSKVVKELVRSAIPVTSEAGEKLTEYPEIKLLTDILKLIAFYADDAPLCASLKSAIGNFGEEELAEIRRPYPREISFLECSLKYETEGENPSIRRKLKNFREYFEKIRLISEFTGAGEILSRIMKDTGLDIEIASMPLGSFRIERVEKFIKESFVSGKALTVNEFLQRIEVAGSDMTISPKGGEDTVKVMSIHASKGLEFPVVIVAGLKRNFSIKDRIGEVLSDRKFGIALKSYDEESKTSSETLVRQYFKEKLRLDAIKEEARIFYVALTRAKCRLHLICEAKVKDEFSPFDLFTVGKFSDFLTKGDMPIVVHDRNELSSMEKQAKKNVLIGKGSLSLEEKTFSALSYIYPYEKDEGVSVKSAVTKISESVKPVPPVIPVEKEELYFGTSFIDKGTAYHKFMEKCDFNKDAFSEIERLLSEGILTEEQAKYLDGKALNRVLSSEVVKRLKGYELYREQPFTAYFMPSEIGQIGRDGKTLVQGVIDLLAVKEGEAIIIDYKTSGRPIEKLKETYSVQLKLYSIAVERVLKLKVKEKIIINLLNGEYIVDKG